MSKLLIANKFGRRMFWGLEVEAGWRRFTETLSRREHNRQSLIGKNTNNETQKH